MSPMHVQTREAISPDGSLHTMNMWRLPIVIIIGTCTSNAVHAHHSELCMEYIIRSLEM